MKHALTLGEFQRFENGASRFAPEQLRY